MQILTVAAYDFASYFEVDFDFKNQGLTLISGATGSGKSTLCDIVPWVLFGRTAKGGAVDEVCSWNSDRPAFGRVLIRQPGRNIEVLRIRNKQRYLEFYFLVHDHITGIDPKGPTRGKDTLDTQRLLNLELGLDYELYMAGAYYHEFSAAASFFTATAKNRRTLTEQLVNLSLAKSLNINLTDYKKEVKKEKIDLETRIMLRKADLGNNIKTQLSENAKAAAWDFRHKDAIKKLKQQAVEFEVIQEGFILKIHEQHELRKSALQSEIISLQDDIMSDSHFAAARAKITEREADCKETVCSECGSKKDTHIRLLIVKDLHTIQNAELTNNSRKIALKNNERLLKQCETSFTDALNKELARTNTYEEQANVRANEVNPHRGTEVELRVQAKELEALIFKLQLEIDEFSVELADIDVLLDITDEFRTVLVKSTIVQLETSTNKLLTDHFDAEIRVIFQMQDADKLEVTILKDGNHCSYTQLSKGQRQLLKLCFGVSVMRAVANHHGVDFSSVFFDEAFDGLDETLKVKAFSLLKSLEQEYDSIFVVEHSTELKGLFDKQFVVSLNNGNSEITSV